MTEADRSILHVDLDCFYASVETVLNPALRGHKIAVAGSVEDRHGIILAKSELAKRAGVKTAMTVGDARRLCPDITLVPPQFHMYMRFSQLVRKICRRYTDLIEPFGLDECWLDVTGSRRYGTGVEIAESIRRAITFELGLTASVGVSFNKIFAKLGSDMNKPDGMTVITRDNYRELVWPRPVKELLFVGHSTEKTLSRIGIETIGDLAESDPALLEQLLGVTGLALHRYATGEDRSPVLHADTVIPLKSIGHGITTNADLVNEEEVAGVILELSQEIGRRLRKERLYASGIQIAIRDNTLDTKQMQSPLPYPTQNAGDIAAAAVDLYHRAYRQECGIRSVTVRTVKLLASNEGEQRDFFTDYDKVERRIALDRASDDITSRYGRSALRPAAVLLNTKTTCERAFRAVSTLPSAYHK